MKLSDIHPYENNPRMNDGAVEAVAESIRQCTYIAPIIVDENHVILAGHTRYKALQKLGYTEAQVIIKSGLTDKQKRKYRLLDNKTAEIAEWDFDLLETELDGLDFDGFDFMFDISEDKKEDRGIIEDEAPEVNESEEPKAKIGQVWKLGNHRLMCGDSTNADDIAKLTNGKQVDLVFTDPPYGMKKESDGVLGDNLNYDDLLEFNKKWIPISFDVLKDMGSWYCWGIDEPLMDIYSHILKPLARQNKIVLRNYLTWAKHSAFGMKSSLMLSYPRETEKCWFVVKGQNWNNNNAEFFNYKYEPVLDYLKKQAEIVGLTAKELFKITGVQMFGHWFSKSQFTVIPENHYAKLQRAYNGNGAFLLSYQELRELIGNYNDKKSQQKPYFDITWFDDGDMPLSDVWRNSITTQKERENTGTHATPKPLAICERAIVSSTREKEIVLDLFGGSGSTLIACEQLNRTCYMMELSPQYIDAIIKRFENFTGEKAVLLNGEK